MNPLSDERIMADGRPAYAWWNELKMLRQEVRQFEKDRLKMVNWALLFKVLYSYDPCTLDHVIYIKSTGVALAKNMAEVWEHPERFVKVEAHNV